MFTNIQGFHRSTYIFYSTSVTEAVCSVFSISIDQSRREGQRIPTPTGIHQGSLSPGLRPSQTAAAAAAAASGAVVAADQRTHEKALLLPCLCLHGFTIRRCLEACLCPGANF